MKRIVIYILASLVMLLFCVGCSSQEDNTESTMPPVISLRSTGEEINSKVYKEDSFGVNYEDLPTLTLIKNEDVLQIALSENFPSKIVIREHYYISSNSYANEYELEKDNDNIVSLPISRRSSLVDEQAIYYLSNGKKNNKREFIFKVILPIAKME